VRRLEVWQLESIARVRFGRNLRTKLKRGKCMFKGIIFGWLFGAMKLKYCIHYCLCMFFT
jgi:hypothetical protein